MENLEPVHKVNRMASQGDVLFRRVDSLPKGAELKKQAGSRVVVAHSDAGHHHAIDDVGVAVYTSGDPLKSYLVFDATEFATVHHLRDAHKHDALQLLGGQGAIWEVIRQREFGPEGWRRVED